MKRLVVMGTVAAAALAVGLGAAVSAEGGPSLTDTSARFPDRFYGIQLPERRLLTASDVSVTENGQDVDNLSVTSPGGPGSVAILTIDASNSMKGAPIADAMKAARAFAARRNPGTALGVVFFNNEVAVALPPTRDRVAIADVLAEPPALAEGTKIYDALGVSASQLETAGATTGSVVLLTDGDDVGSVATEEVALDRLHAENARVFAVGLRSDAYSPETLQTLATETGGTYTEVSGSSSLAPVFDALGFRLAKEYLVFYRSLVKPEQQVDVVIRIEGYDQPLRTSYTSPALNLADGTVSKSFWDRLVQSWAFMILIAVAILWLLAYGVRKVLSVRRGPMRGRIAQYVDPDVERLEATDDVFDRIESVGRRLERKGPMQHFSDMCSVGAVDMRPSVLAVLGFVGGLVLAVLLAVIWAPWAFLLGALVPLGVWLYVRRKVHTRRKRFGEQLPEDLDVLAAALRAGHSLAGGFAVMADQAAEPSRSEFRRVVTDEQLGIQLDEALDRVGLRMENRDMDQVALIALLARETGGSSAEVIDQVASNIRARMDVRRLVHTLTAQGRLARWIVSFMPVFLVLAIYVIFPNYLDPLFNTTVGLAMFIVAAVMVIAGSLVIKRIVEIKI